MKRRIWTALLLALVAGGILSAGCTKKGGMAPYSSDNSQLHADQT